MEMLIAGCEDEFCLCHCWVYKWTSQASEMEADCVRGASL